VDPRDDSTSDLLMGVARSMRRAFGAALEEYDVTPSQARALRMAADVVSGEDPPRLSVLADRLRIAPRSATEVVDALEARGLVERQPDPADRRASRVAATEEGLRLTRVLSEARRVATESYLAVLSPEDRAELDRILRLLAED
jgi:DNA-binding MarR family transcriptional regulator